MRLRARLYRSVWQKKSNNNNSTKFLPLATNSEGGGFFYLSMLTHSILNYKQSHGFPHFSPRCVLFDMDGVLYDSMKNHAVAWHEAMAQFGIDFSAADSYATEGARGVDTIRHYVKQQQGRDITEAEAQRMYDVKAELFHRMPIAEIFPGVLDIMQRIQSAGLTIGVVTGSGQRPLIQRLLTDFRGFLTEDHIVSAYDVKRGKPNPDPYLMGLRKAGNLEPWQGIVVENAPLGVRAGSAANIFTIGINSGPLPDSALADNGANIVLQRMTELCDLWDEILSAAD